MRAPAKISGSDEQQLASALREIRDHLDFSKLAADALTGIGSLLQPEGAAADEQLNLAHRSEASAVFRFFGEALKKPAIGVYEAYERLERNLRAGTET